MSNIFIDVIISIFSSNSIGDKVTGITATRHDNVNSVGYPQNNMAIYVPFVLENPTRITGLVWYNGATVANKVDMGIYTDGGTMLVSTGGINASGSANTLQSFNINTTVLGAGLYFMGFSSNSVTGTYFAVTGTASSIGAIGVFQQSGSYPLPATAVFSTATVNYIPVMGISGRSLI